MGVDTFTYKVDVGASDGNTATVVIAVGGRLGERTNLESNATESSTQFLLTGGLQLAQELAPGLSLIYQSNTLP